MSSLCSSALFHDFMNMLNNCILNHKYINYNFFFIDINECMVFGSCSQHCHNLKGSYRCDCEKNYKERNNSCIAKGKAIKIKIDSTVVCYIYLVHIFLKQICHGKILLMSHSYFTHWMGSLRVWHHCLLLKKSDYGMGTNMVTNWRKMVCYYRNTDIILRVYNLKIWESLS